MRSKSLAFAEICNAFVTLYKNKRMTIFTASQMQQWDAYTMAHEPITSIDLMERAAQQCSNFLIENNTPKNGIKIFCGKGNNGGDGLAIARQLIQAGYKPFVYIIDSVSNGSRDFQENLNRLQPLTPYIFFIKTTEDLPAIDTEDLIIDALFGTGLNRPLEGMYKSVVEHINQYSRRTIAIDLPSGMASDSTSKKNTIIRAGTTLTFQAVKLCCLVPESQEFLGNIIVLSIGLDEGFIKQTDTKYALTQKNEAAAIYKPRQQFAHKGTYGHALLYAGNTGKMGAAVLCAKACLRIGVGLLTCTMPQQEFHVLQTTVSEAMVADRKEEIAFEKYATIGIGPGIGTTEYEAQNLHKIITSFAKPMVIDADALNIISGNKTWLSHLPKNTILTPHPKEFDRLFGDSENDFERIDKALQASLDFELVIVLKGHNTLVAYKGKGYFNTTGNPGMATGGSGDMLTGVVTSLLAQKYEPLDAAILGIYLHGLAADISVENTQSYESLLPTDMIESMGAAFKYIQKIKES